MEKKRGKRECKIKGRRGLHGIELGEVRGWIRETRIGGGGSFIIQRGMIVMMNIIVGINACVITIEIFV